ncbi:MAG: universal stress protein [Salibaculum sp.]|uniref:universal stress protein n=1 Tax=Roseovarius halophilus (ex Wu et al. 2025) TaxID=3376060 RepID=UPI0028704DCC|nr:universal stress protein [Salibaculum sp.]MDR9428512.1 universal stress protein [Salibaculum sp.]MDR9482591.1 universal stress protein [Salibaculum sp.]
MAYKTISLIVTDSVADAPALTAAAEIAVRERAHLDVHALGIDPAHYEAMPVGTAAVVLDPGTDEARQSADDLVAWAEGVLATYDLSAVVAPAVVTTMGLDGTVARLARYADLVVAAQPYGEGASQLQVLTLEAALFGTGAPVMVVPRAACDFTEPLDRAMIAWDESDECLEAVRKALPVLREADHTDIVMVDPPSHSPERSDPGGVLCLMLARQGVKSEVSILAKTLPRVSGVLNRFVTEHGTEMIIMGAYGHSRMREAVLGGPTREMLETATVPILMAH